MFHLVAGLRLASSCIWVNTVLFSRCIGLLSCEMYLLAVVITVYSESDTLSHNGVFPEWYCCNVLET